MVHYRAGGSGQRGFHNLAGRVLSDQKVLEISRVGSDRLKRFSNRTGGLGSP